MTRRALVLGLLRDLLICAGVGVVAYVLGIVAFGAKVPYPLYVVVFLAILLGVRIASIVWRPGPENPMIREDAGARVVRVPDRPFGDARHLEERFELVQGDADYFARTVLPVIAELVDERLRLSRGISRTTHPAEARALMGERLWALLDPTLQSPTAAPGRKRAPSVGELNVVVSELEELWAKCR